MIEVDESASYLLDVNNGIFRIILENSATNIIPCNPFITCTLNVLFLYCLFFSFIAGATNSGCFIFSQKWQLRYLLLQIIIHSFQKSIKKQYNFLLIRLFDFAVKLLIIIIYVGNYFELAFTYS